MESDLIERIYACSFIPELWNGVLGDLAALASARAGCIFVTNGDFRRATSSTEAGREALTSLVPTGYIERIRRVQTLSAMRYSGFMRDSDMFTEEEMREDPFYRDVLYPRGLGWAAGTNFDLPTGDRVIFSVEREYARGPVEPEVVAALDELRPHLGRATLIATRLQLERAHSSSETLALIGLPALVLDQRGKVLAANSLVQEMTGEVLVWRAFDQLTLQDKNADRLLGEAIASINIGARTVRSFPIRGADPDVSMIAHVVPIRREAKDIFVQCSAMLVIMPLNRVGTPPADLIQALFDFTPAEARVAQKVAIGKSIDDIAADTGVSRNTVRTHMRGVLEKTGCARQAEAAALLGNVSLLRSEAIP